MAPPTAPAPVAKLGYVEQRTQDLDRLVAHYTDALCFDVVERSPTRVHLALGSEHHAMVLSQGEPTGRASVGLQLAGDLEDAARALGEAGIAVERRSDEQPGIGEALVVGEAGTGVPLVLYESMSQTGAPTTLGPRPTKIGHVASFAPSLPETQGFYQDVLGFKWSDTINHFFTFMRCNSDHHAVNVMESTKREGLHHVAFEARDIVHLKDILDQLARHAVRLDWGPGRHGPGHNIFSYHRDPDGNTIEVFCEIDVVLDERAPRWEPRPWHEEFPMGPKHWPQKPESANQWGPMDVSQLEH